ncbi:MAG TPA: CPBP family intramembrane glutamic endopeptidase [Acidimicrobiales bacterium]|nr:CPBP family intramembrane glutamic endopeptidase [Acidimicrobiales bacterium]
MEPQPPQTTAPGAPRWGLGDFALGLFVGYALASLLAGVWFAVSGDDDELDIAGQALTQIGLWTGMVGAVVLASKRKGAGRLDEDFGFRAGWSDVGVGLAVALATQLVLLPAIALLLRPLLGEPEVSGPVRDLLDQSQGPAYLGLLASVAVGAPIVEELFFRGLLLRSLQRRMPDAAAVAVSAVVFGLAHGSTLPAEAVVLVIVSLTAFGAVLAVLALRTGRLGPGIVAHAVFNLFTVLYLTVNPG